LKIYPARYQPKKPHQLSMYNKVSGLDFKSPSRDSDFWVVNEPLSLYTGAE
jgi:hypothetical protein